MGATAVRILGRIWRIKFVKGLSTDGLCEYGKATLKVRTGMDLHDRKDTVLHELMHAVLYQQGREYGDEVEETYVRALATGLIGVFQDNPDLAAWLVAPNTRRGRA